MIKWSKKGLAHSTSIYKDGQHYHIKTEKYGHPNATKPTLTFRFVNRFRCSPNPHD